jgi:hypothetical protein
MFSFGVSPWVALTCSQIWLIPLVDDHHFGYITKLEIKRKKKEKKETPGS